MRKFEPYVSSDQKLPELSIRGVLIGCLLGIVFGAANTYLGLRVGLTISTTIPISVLTVMAFMALPPFKKIGSILEANMSQTIGSASSSLASGMIFTTPALFLWNIRPELPQLVLIAFVGGLLGVCFMVPLRKFLIQDEHATLPYPEAVACSEVLKAADRGGQESWPIFQGILSGSIFKFCADALKLWKNEFSFHLPFIPKAYVALEAGAALLGVGFILGVRVAGIMVAGGSLAWLVIIPLLHVWGAGRTEPLYPETVKLIADMTPSELWTKYIRYIGAGAVACGGMISLAKSIPTIVQSFKVAVTKFKTNENLADADRLERDISMRLIAGIVLGCVVVMSVSPLILSMTDSILIRTLCALLITMFAFFFVTVSSRIVGMVGVTSNPTSGMTIATLLATSGLFLLFGWQGPSAMAQALCIGAVVATAASIAGDMSQDLKAGFILGATPWKQQVGQLLGVATSVVFVCLTLVALEKTYGFGSKELPAPQANLMKIVIEGVLSNNLPWGLVLIGVGLSLIVFFLGLPVLAFAVGIYLPLATMTPVFVGGLIRWYVEYRYKGKNLEKRTEKGVLFGSGLVGGEGLVGVGVAMFALLRGQKPQGFGSSWAGSFESLMPLLVFTLLATALYRTTKTKS